MYCINISHPVIENHVSTMHRKNAISSQTNLQIMARDTIYKHINIYIYIIAVFFLTCDRTCVQKETRTIAYNREKTQKKIAK